MSFWMGTKESVSIHHNITFSSQGFTEKCLYGFGFNIFNVPYPTCMKVYLVWFGILAYVYRILLVSNFPRVYLRRWLSNRCAAVILYSIIFKVRRFQGSGTFLCYSHISYMIMHVLIGKIPSQWSRKLV